MFSILFITFLLTAISTVDAISVISIKGAKFFNADGEQVYFKGVAYQRSPYDPFVNETQCQLDAQLMKTLGANAIRTYHVDPTQNHDDCMQAFSDAGIYLFLDIDTFTTQIEETNPQWTYNQYTAFTAVIDAFSKYDNLAGFFVANEAVTEPNGTDAAPFVKAATRDTKAYMKSKGGRYIPIGYSAADIATIRPMFQNYLVCGPSSDTIDFFAVNIYEWCGASSFQTSGYEDRLAEFQNYPVPTFFSEDGCITIRPRTFSDMAAIYGPDMDSVLSGTFIYEWTQEPNDYGIIEYPDIGFQDGLNVSVGSPVPLQPEFGNLQSQWAAVTPTGVSLNAYTPTNSAPDCPATTSGIWDISGDLALPDTPSKQNPSPSYSGIGGNATGTSSGTSSGTAGGSSASGKSLGSKTVGGDNYGPWIAFLAACIALGCMV